MFFSNQSVKYHLKDRNIQSSVDVRAYGAVGDGTSDDTASIQNAIDTGAANVYIPDGTYMIDALISLSPKSNQKIQLSENAILKAIPNTSENYSIITLKDVTNIEISGGTLLGERNEHVGELGQWGFGIMIYTNTNNIVIRNLSSKDFWGDGIYIGSGESPTGIAKNILIENIVCDNNRRQGISITHAENVTIKSSTFKNTKGTPPESGIDLEPNSGCYVKNVSIENCKFLNNTGPGILLYGGLGLYVKTVNIENCVFSGNRTWLSTGSNVSDISTSNNIFE